MQFKIVGKTPKAQIETLMFSDDYESIRQHMKQYIETGSTTTPSHGRGQ